jgi:anti-sigma B factor antagonist
VTKVRSLTANLRQKGSSEFRCSLDAGRVKQLPVGETHNSTLSRSRINLLAKAHNMSSSEGSPRHEPSFRVGVSRANGQVLVAVEGELDLATAPQLRDHLVEMSEEKVEVILDLTRLQFIDSTGLSVLVMAFNRARAAGGSIVLRHPSQSVLRVLEITGLVSVFTIETDSAVPSSGS